MHDYIIAGEKYEGNFQAMKLTSHGLLTSDICVIDRRMIDTVPHVTFPSSLRTDPR